MFVRTSTSHVQLKWGTRLYDPNISTPPPDYTGKCSLDKNYSNSFKKTFITKAEKFNCSIKQNYSQFIVAAISLLVHNTSVVFIILSLYPHIHKKNMFLRSTETRVYNFKLHLKKTD